MIESKQNFGATSVEKMLFEDAVINEHGERMHGASKAEFRDFVTLLAEKLGFDVKIEKNVIAKNIVIGNPEKAKVLVGAHYDTPPRMPQFFIEHQISTFAVAMPIIYLGIGIVVPEIAIRFMKPQDAIKLLYGLDGGTKLLSFGALAYVFGFLGNANKNNKDDNSSGVLTILNLLYAYKDLPKEEKDKVAFVLFDNEEKFLLGSLSYARKHKSEITNQNFVNVDCVGVGKKMNLLHFGEKTPLVDKMKDVIEDQGEFVPEIKKSSVLASCSDHLAFRKAKGHVCLLAVEKDNPRSLYQHVHSKFDDHYDKSNILASVDAIKSVVNEVANIDSKNCVVTPMRIEEYIAKSRRKKMGYVNSEVGSGGSLDSHLDSLNRYKKYNNCTHNCYASEVEV